MTLREVYEKLVQVGPMYLSSMSSLHLPSVFVKALHEASEQPSIKNQDGTAPSSSGF